MSFPIEHKLPNPAVNTPNNRKAGKSMKDKLITEIQASMVSLLSAAQLEELRRVLTYNLRNVEVTERKATEPQETVENGKLLEVFIAAKRIEGCSEKSLKYYATTIHAMLEAVIKPIQISAGRCRRCNSYSYGTM